MIRVLSIGNSFSQNATQWLEVLTEDVYSRNLYIGGCGLERHRDNVLADAKEYHYEESGSRCIARDVSVKEVLLAEKWDFVTFQQDSGHSGLIGSFYPYLTELFAYVRQYTDAEFLLHETWAYDVTTNHPHFEYYDRDPKKMYRMISETYREVSEKEGLRVIRSGDAVEKLRATEPFDSGKGGLFVTCEDGFHLSENYGKFLVACVWMKFFTGKTPVFFDRKELSAPYAAIRDVVLSL